MNSIRNLFVLFFLVAHFLSCFFRFSLRLVRLEGVRRLRQGMRARIELGFLFSYNKFLLFWYNILFFVIPVNLPDAFLTPTFSALSASVFFGLPDFHYPLFTGIGRSLEAIRMALLWSFCFFKTPSRAHVHLMDDFMRFFNFPIRKLKWVFIWDWFPDFKLRSRMLTEAYRCFNGLMDSIAVGLYVKYAQKRWHLHCLPVY